MAEADPGLTAVGMQRNPERVAEGLLLDLGRYADRKDIAVLVLHHGGEDVDRAGAGREERVARADLGRAVIAFRGGEELAIEAVLRVVHAQEGREWLVAQIDALRLVAHARGQ